MGEKIITLAIEKLAGLGDGMGRAEGRKLFVPYTLPGDVVTAVITHTIDGVSYGVLQEVKEKAAGRVAPGCKHFADCGGCALQHLESSSYNEFKWQMAREAVRKAGYDVETVAPLVSMPAASRRRVELKIENGRLGYYAARSHRLVEIDECKVLEPKLEALVLWLKGQGLEGAGGIRINGADNGYDVVIEGRQAKRLFMREAGVPATGRPSMALGNAHVNLPPGAFLQASAAAQDFMTGWVKEAVGDAAHVLDLFAGIGIYSFTLPASARVAAIEGDAAMVKAVREAARGTGIKVEQRDLFKYPFKAPALKGFDCVIVNPPRSGAKAQCEELARAVVPKVIMISCNPATFARDARALRAGGYRLKRLTPLDQFVYSSHLELLAEFVR